MALNGISTLSTKQLKQEGKLDIAEAKRQGKTVADDGTITGSVDPTKEYYRTLNSLDINLLPTRYSGNNVVDNTNPAGLVVGRPWTTSVVTADLQMFLDAGDVDSYAGTGSTWTDIQGNANGTLINSPSHNIATGFTLNGVDQIITMPDTTGVTDFSNTDDYTVEVWFNPASGQPVGGGSLIEKWNYPSQQDYPYVFRYNEGTSLLRVAVYDGANNPGSNITGISTNTWHQVAGTFKFSTNTLTTYHNGQLANTASLAGVGAVSNPSLVFIGARGTSATAGQYHFKGSVAIVRIYDTALSGANIATNFAANRQRFNI